MSSAVPRSTFLGLLIALASVPAQEETTERWLDDAEAALERGRDPMALTLIERVLNVRPNDEAALSLGVAAAMNTSRYADADRWSEIWVLGGSRESLRRRGEVLARLGRLDEAIALLAPLLAEPSSAPPDAPGFDCEALGLVARWHRARGRDDVAGTLYDRLVAEAKRVVIRAPSDLVALSDAYLFFRGRVPAERALLDAKKRDPKSVPVLLALGGLYRDVSELPREAAKEFQAALSVRPELSIAHVELARTYRVWARESEALGAWKRAQAIAPDLPEALGFSALEALGDLQLESAKSSIDRMRRVDPTLPEALALLSAWHYLRGESDAYEASVALAEQRDPTYGRGPALLGGILNERRRWPEALEQLRSAVVKDPKAPELWDELARYAFFLGHEDEGKAALAKADALALAGTRWRNNMWKVQALLDAEYDSVETAHFRHRFHRGDAKRVPYLRYFCEESHRITRERYGVSPPGLLGAKGPILVEHFRNHDDFAVRTLGFSSLGALGVCFGPFIAMGSPTAHPDDAWFRTFHHELAHTFTLSLSDGRLPRWLTEGLSTLEEQRFDPSWNRGLHRDLFDAWKGEELLRVEEFDRAFHTPRVIYAYFQAGLVCQHLEERFGFPAVLSFVRAFATTPSTDEAARRAFGVPPSDLDASFEQFVARLLAPVRLEPRPSAAGLAKLVASVHQAPADGDARVRLALALLDAGRVPDAQEEVYRAQRAGARGGRLDFVLGRLALVGKNDVGARERFEAALAQGYENHDLSRLAASVLVRSGARRDAIPHLRRAIAQFPQVGGAASPRVELAKLLTEADEADERRDVLESHLLTTFEDVATRKELLEQARARGDTPTRLRHLEALVHLAPNTPEIHSEVGELWLDVGRYAAAEAAFTVALAFVEGTDAARAADAWIGRASAAYAQRSDRAEVEPMIDNALALVPEHSKARELRSRIATAPPGSGVR